jgi:murein DD-endopeptidase MepM/ murein hydrolase activator NlpD
VKLLTQKRVVLLITAVILVLAAFPGLKIIADALTKKTAYEFIVDNQKWFTVSQKDSLGKILEQYKKHYLADVAKNARIKSITFLQKVDIVEVEVRPEEIDSLKVAKEKIYAVDQEAIVIKIKKGDNFWNISRANHITVDQLETLNPDVDPDKIFPGEKLIIRPANPKLDVVVELENKVMEAIPFRVEYIKDKNLYKNEKKIIKEGIEGQKEVIYNIVLRNGYQSSLQVKSERDLKNPVNAIVKIGTKTTVSMGGRINYGVVRGKRVSSRYGSRIHPITGRRRFHSGLDIAAPHGSPVYAYAAGKIVEAGWNGGYGKCILIDHGNGLKTRYGHLSTIYVRVGQRVATEAKIGAVGSTGNSTGPHLHFEVIKWGWTKNPLNYI